MVMQTRKEALLALLKGEKADFIPEVYSTMKDVVFPGDRYIDLEHFDPYGTGPDAWGVLWTNQGPNPVVNGNTVAANYKMFDDMDEWKDHVKFPPLDFMPLGDIFGGMCAGMHVDPENDVVSCLILSGTFERMNQLIGMENALCAFYEYPDEVHEFFDAMCEYKLKCIDYAVKYLHPDCIHMHDDWGTNNNMFFSPELWREFIKPCEEKYAKRIHEHGCLYIHHSCGYIKQIIPDLIEIGVDVLEPLMVENGVEDVLEQYGNQITIMGGLDNRIIDAVDSAEESIRAEVRKNMGAFCGKYRYIPYYIPAIEDNWKIYIDEVNKYGAQIFQKQ
jgi:Uroporphyrinogen-III decarboxylase